MCIRLTLEHRYVRVCTEFILVDCKLFYVVGRSAIFLVEQIDLTTLLGVEFNLKRFAFCFLDMLSVKKNWHIYYI